jgi:hypothetical protein
VLMARALLMEAVFFMLCIRVVILGIWRGWDEWDG